MKIVLVSSYYNHHQKLFCEILHSYLKGEFCFISTSEIRGERIQLGYEVDNTPIFVRKIGNNKDGCVENYRIIDESDIVIMGNAPLELRNCRFNNDRLTFFYAERIYKNGYNVLKWPIRLIRFWQLYGRYNNVYLLCASAFTAADYAKHFTFLNKSYKWGYFPETKHYDIEALENKKNRKKILWCGRFIDWKHPDDAIVIAEYLLADSYDFDMDFIGTGEMEETLKRMICEKGLEDNVHFLGSMRPEMVRRYMEQAGIYIFTSDFGEGWGAVLNESMNSGCAVVASHAIGSVPFLMKHRENGLIYKNGNINDLYRKVKFLLDNPDEQKRMGQNAYHSIVDLWNAEIAVERFLKFAEEIKDHGYCDLYEDGPCSRAEIIKNDWFKGSI